MDDVEFKKPLLIETPDGDLVKPEEIGGLRYWPATDFEPNHRVQLNTINGGHWQLYKGPSREDAIRIRDDMKARIKAATEHPLPLAAS